MEEKKEEENTLDMRNLSPKNLSLLFPFLLEKFGPKTIKGAKEGGSLYLLQGCGSHSGKEESSGV